MPYDCVAFPKWAYNPANQNYPHCGPRFGLLIRHESAESGTILRNPDCGVTYITNVMSDQIKAGLRLHINMHFAESGPTSPGLRRLSMILTRR